jgi:hypothetical protein
VEKRFLFDGVKLNSGSIARWNKEFAIAIEPYATDSVPPRWNLASMTAREALNPALRHGLIEHTFLGVAVKLFLQCAFFNHNVPSESKVRGLGNDVKADRERAATEENAAILIDWCSSLRLDQTL